MTVNANNTINKYKAVMKLYKDKSKMNSVYANIAYDEMKYAIGYLRCMADLNLISYKEYKEIASVVMDIYYTSFSI